MGEKVLASIVDDPSDGGLVDAHPKGHGGDDDLQLIQPQSVFPRQNGQKTTR